VLERIFTTIGVAGFLAVFQAIGAGFIRGAWSLVGEAWRESRRGQLVGGFGISLFGAAWSLFPLIIAAEISGWTGFLAQLVILGVLLGIFFRPLPEEEGEKKAARSTRPPASVKSLRRLVTVEQPPLGPEPLWRRVLPALSAFLLALAYLSARLDLSLPGLSREWLSLLVKVEFLVIHSFPFLALITLPRLKWRRWRVFQWFLFVTWMCLYLAFAVADENGLAGSAACLAATAGTYLGFMLRWKDARRVAALAVRWLVSFLLFMLAAGIAGSEDWRYSPALLLHGLIYFTAVGVLEASGLYERDWLRPFRRFVTEGQTDTGG